MFLDLKINSEFIIIIIFTVWVSYRGGGRTEAKSCEGAKDI